MRNVNVRAAFRGTKEKFVVFLHWPPRSMPMSQDDEDRFRPRLGRIRSDARGGAATKSFFTRVRKIARQHGAGPPGASAYGKSGGIRRPGSATQRAHPGPPRGGGAPPFSSPPLFPSPTGPPLTRAPAGAAQLHPPLHPRY